MNFAVNPINLASIIVNSDVAGLYGSFSPILCLFPSSVKNHIPSKSGLNEGRAKIPMTSLVNDIFYSLDGDEVLVRPNVNS